MKLNFIKESKYGFIRVKFRRKYCFVLKYKNNKIIETQNDSRVQILAGNLENDFSECRI